MSLALRVPPPLTEEVMREARDRGIYDDSRSVRRVGEHIEVPVELSFGEYETVEQDDPELRRVSLGDFVDDPPPYTLIGDVALVEFGDTDPERERDIAEALEDLHGVQSVLEDLGFEGKTRVPQTRHVAGERETETVHRENGFEFALDPRKAMFSVGNAAERVHIHEVVGKDETVFDMFAGIGYFAVPAAVGGADVVAAEIRETSHTYLVENAERNEVTDSLDTRHADCLNVDIDTDRVIMGHFDATENKYLEHGLESLGKDGVLHVHDAVHEDASEETINAVKEAARKNGYDVRTELRRIKGIAEGVAHVIVDAYVS